MTLDINDFMIYVAPYILILATAWLILNFIEKIFFIGNKIYESIRYRKLVKLSDEGIYVFQKIVDIPKYEGKVPDRPLEAIEWEAKVFFWLPYKFKNEFKSFPEKGDNHGICFSWSDLHTHQEEVLKRCISEKK